MLIWGEKYNMIFEYIFYIINISYIGKFYDMREGDYVWIFY